MIRKVYGDEFMSNTQIEEWYLSDLKVVVL